MNTEKTNAQQPGNEVLVVDDGLLFSVRIENILRKLGYSVKVVGNEPEARAWANAHPLVLAIINFGSERTSAADTVRHLKALPHPPAVLGFISHTWIPQVRPAAMEAGCDLLVANSVISTRLPQLVARLAPLDGATVEIPDAQEFVEEE